MFPPRVIFSAMSISLPRRNPLPQLTPPRVRRLHQQMRELQWERSTELSIARSEEQHQAILPTDAASLSLQPLPPGALFGRGGDQWTQFWLRADLVRAADDERGRRFLRWQCQGETTVWIDGRPWAGLDPGHPECPLPDDEGPIWLECCSWQTGIWIAMVDSAAIGPQGLRFDGAQVAVRSADAWACYCDLDAIVQMMDLALSGQPDLKLAKRIGYSRALETASPRLRRMLHELDQLCDQWQACRDVRAAGRACSDFLARWPAEAWQPTAALCGHAHLDLVWLWPESATRKKVVHSFATVLQLLERYPEFIFVQSMPALYRMLEAESPEIMAEIHPLIEAGRWEVLGGFEVEPDVNLPGGEALARSLAIGQDKIEALTGKPSEVAWIPDVFGYSQCLPQILALGGVKYFFTTKMTWSSITKFPYTSFVWRGADGSEVLTHLGVTDYNGEVRLDVHDRAMAEHRQSGVHPELLLPTGYGDGGGGPTELHLERARRFANLSGSPRTTWTRADDFFARLDGSRETLPVYQGELYLEYHRGTYTTQSECKRLYRRAEQALQAHEGVSVALEQSPLPEDAWLRLLFVHFHDALPGSSIGEVYAELNPELQEIGDREFARAATALGNHGRADQTAPAGKAAAFNAMPYDRVAVVGSEGEAAQVRLPALGSAAFDPDLVPSQPIVEASPSVLRHERLTARFNPQGQLAALVVDGRPLDLAGPTGLLMTPDDPVAFDAWDIDHDAAGAGNAVADCLSLEVVENSPARAVLQSDWAEVGRQSEIRLRYVLEAGCTHLKIEIEAAWQEDHQLLRLVAATGYRGRHAMFGCPFGAIARPQLPGVEADEAMWEVPGSRWAAVIPDSGDDGLAIVAESKLGYAARDGVLSVSLLRGARWPDPDADRGHHTMRLALGRFRHAADSQNFSTSMAADALYSPPLRYTGQLHAGLFRWEALGTVNPSWCAPSSLHPDAYFIRLHETAGRSGVAELHLQHPVQQAEFVDLRERSLETLPVNANGRIAIPYRPWQILTVRIHRSH